MEGSIFFLKQYFFEVRVVEKKKNKKSPVTLNIGFICFVTEPEQRTIILCKTILYLNPCICISQNQILNFYAMCA